jgi:hypothetical protein
LTRVIVDDVIGGGDDGHENPIARAGAVEAGCVTTLVTTSTPSRGSNPYKPMDRTTVSRGRHQHAPQDASLRDMPLHALRHTAATAWLTAGNSLMYVQQQLGHADISTPEHYHGHLERQVLAAGAVATEDAIARLPSGNPRATTSGREWDDGARRAIGGLTAATAVRAAGGPFYAMTTRPSGAFIFRTSGFGSGDLAGSSMTPPSLPQAPLP